MRHSEGIEVAELAGDLFEVPRHLEVALLGPSKLQHNGSGIFKALHFDEQTESTLQRFGARRSSDRFVPLNQLVRHDPLPTELHPEVGVLRLAGDIASVSMLLQHSESCLTLVQLFVVNASQLTRHFRRFLRIAFDLDELGEQLGDPRPVLLLLRQPLQA